MKKYFAIFAAIAILGMLAIYFLPEKKLSSTSATTVATTTQPTTTSSTDSTATDTSSTATTSTTSPTTSSTSTSSTSSSSSLKNGTFNGSSSSTPYGNVQIAIVVSGGKITDVKYLAYPSDDRHSEMISSQALPILKSETLSAQSANIDSVSGASYTSQGYAESLQAAIDAAKA